MSETYLNSTKQEGKDYFDARYIRSDLSRNLIINPDGDLAQRGASGSASFTAATTPANNDDTYLLDRWCLLSDGNDVVDVSQNTDAPDGSMYAMKFVIATINKKFGIVQFIENKNCAHLQDKTVSLSFQAKTTAAKLLGNLRATVLSWTGGVDAITSDLVNAWGASGADITPIANFTIEKAGTNLALTTSYKKFEIPAISVDTASMDNLAVFIWLDDTDGALNDELFISQIQLNSGNECLDYVRRSFKEELAMCQRYYCKSYNIDVAPGAVTTVGIKQNDSSANANGSYAETLFVEYPVIMRTTPTAVSYGAGGIINRVTMQNGSRTGTIQTAGMSGHSVIGGNTAATTDRKLQHHYTSDAEL